MLFNSYFFICVFLPVTLLVFFAIGRRAGRKVAIGWLVAASLFFYGWWNPAYVSLLVGSILFNFTMGSAIFREHHQRGAGEMKLPVFRALRPARMYGV